MTRAFLAFDGSAVESEQPKSAWLNVRPVRTVLSPGVGGHTATRALNSGMAELSELLPELRAWNDGAGIQPLDWVYCIARSDEAVAYTALFWPKFVEFNGYILRDGFNLDNLRSWEAEQHVGRQQIELAVNLLDVGFLFYNSKEPGTAMLEARTVWMLDTLAEIYATKLQRDFPSKKFEVSRLDDENDCAISFCQAPPE